MELLEKDFSGKVNQMLGSSGYARIKCLNHSLHNVVGDGLKVAGRRFEVAIAKVNSVAVLKKKSALFLSLIHI